MDMPVRTGQQYIDGLKPLSPEVWVGGERVTDVTTHPAFIRPMEQIAHLLDMQHDPAHADALTYESPKTGDRVGASFMPSADRAGIEKRRECYRIWAEATFGMMGRSPDFMNVVLLSFAEGREVFARGGERFAENMVSYYEYVRENDIFLTHALVQPPTDRSKASADQAEEFLHVGTVEETANGIVIRGARMLATLGPVADEVLVYNLPLLQKQDTKHAIVFSLPIDAPGLRQICREPFDTGGRSSFDHPLAVNFEEPDSMMIFDDVEVPWDRVYVYNDVEISNAVFPDTNLRNYTAHQTAVRGLVKLQLAAGVALAVARAGKTDQFLHVRHMLGECLNYVEIVKSCILRSEIECEPTGVGTVRPRFEPLQVIRTMLPQWYPRVIEIIQTIGAGGLLAMPSAADFESAIGADIDKYYQGADGRPTEERIRLFRLAWDLCGDAFGMRQLQYERYYAGDPYRAMALNYVTYDSSKCDDLVAGALDLADRIEAGRSAAE
jgi:anthranilate 3-monooxygenase (FAD)/4-hydroxyphenylacetate 3-monooxygenase